jgi:hypothetical protein
VDELSHFLAANGCTGPFVKDNYRYFPPWKLRYKLLITLPLLAFNQGVSVVMTATSSGV